MRLTWGHLTRKAIRRVRRQASVADQAESLGSAAQDSVHSRPHRGGSVAPTQHGDPIAKVAPSTAPQELDPRSERNAIRELFAGNRLSMVLQPIFDTRSGRLLGAEALARFQTDSNEGPDHWFRQAAAIGLSVDLERAAVRRALDLMYEIPSSGYLSVNVSPPTLVSDELMRDLADVPPGRLVLELTDQAELDDYQPLVAAAIRLRARGHRIAIDDAGVANSTLRHIVRLTPHIIKLDNTLTRRIHVDPFRESLVRSLINFADQNDIQIVAEGIETADELRAFKSMEIHAVQGYYLATPGPPPLVRESAVLRPPTAMGP